MYGLRQASANVRWVGLNHLVAVAMRVVYVLAAVRLLGAADYGGLAYGQSWSMTALSLVLLGVSVQFGRALGKDRELGLAFVSATRSPRLMIAALAAGMLCLTAWLWEPDDTIAALIMVFSFALLPRTAALGSEAVLTGLEQGRWTLANNLTWRAVELLLALGVLLVGADIILLAVAHLLSWTFQAVTGWFLEQRAGRAGPVGRASVTAFRKALVRDGFYIALGAFLTGLVGNGVLILFRILQGTGEMLGGVALFVQATGIMLGFVTTSGNAMIPYFSRAAEHGAGHSGVFRSILWGGVGAGALACFVLLGIIDDWVVVLFGPGFDDVLSLLPALGLFATPMLWFILMARLHFVLGNSQALLGSALLGAGSAVLIAPLGIGVLGLGVAGALGAVLLAYLLQAVALIWLMGQGAGSTNRESGVALVAYLAVLTLTGCALCGVVGRPLAMVGLFAGAVGCATAMLGHLRRFRSGR